MAVDWLPEPGETLDERYRLGEQIGVGPTGAVYAATRLLDDHPVVVKVFHPELFEGHPHGMWIDQAGSIYVAEVGAENRLQRFVRV